MHNGIVPYEFVRVEYHPEVYGMTLPNGVALGDYAFPSGNEGHHRWEVLAHEQGHNFFGGTSSFYGELAFGDGFLQESLAVLSAFYTYDSNLLNEDERLLDSLRFDFSNGRNFQEERYRKYIDQGMPFEVSDTEQGSLTSQALDYKMIIYGEEYGWDKYQNLSRLFQSELGSVFNFQKDGVSDEEKSTYIIAVLGVVFNEDFRAEFEELHFTVNETLYSDVVLEMEAFLENY